MCRRHRHTPFTLSVYKCVIQACMERHKIIAIKGLYQNTYMNSPLYAHEKILPNTGSV